MFRLDDEVVAAMMTPRRDIVWLDVTNAWETNQDVIRSHPYSRFPVCDGGLDQVLGIVPVRDLWLAQADGAQAAPELRALARQPLLIPDRSIALDVLEQFQKTGIHVAIVIDEHGGVDGMLTLNNILAFLIAAPTSGTTRPEEVPIVPRGPGSWLVDGSLSLGDSGLAVEDPAAGQVRPYHTVAGLVMTPLGRLPSAGDRITIGPLLVEVVDMDGFRVDKVLVTRQPPRAE